MRNLFFFFFSFVSFVSCHHEGYPSMVRYRYSEKKEVIEKELLRVIKLNSDTIPLKWKQYYKKFDFMDDNYVYFKKNPEEILRIGFIQFGNNWEENDYSELGMFLWFDGKNWYRDYEIDDENKARIIKRLEKEILSKMKYRYEKED